MLRLIELVQQEFDVKKLNDSVNSGKDTCGSYEFCCYCNKKNKYPCGAAIVRLNKEEANDVD